MNQTFTISDFLDAKRQGQKLAGITCYDYTTALLFAQTDIQFILVGDSAAQALLGHDSTLPATMDFMVSITQAVRKAAPNKFLIADMPFLSYQVGIAEAVKNAGRFIAEAAAQMVKIEASEPYLDVIKAVSNAGIPVMAHIGMRPQSITKTGRFKAEATTAEMGYELINLADQMVYSGASSLLLEGCAVEAAKIVTNRTQVPVISCGSGVDCDGQVLTSPDILGLTQHATAKFVKSYGNLGDQIKSIVTEYAKEIQSGKFPDDEHSYHMKKGEIDRLEKLL